MKALYLFTFFLITNISFSQVTYNYYKKSVKAKVQTENGIEYRLINTYQGPYKFVFETPNDPQIKKLFTLLNPGQQNGPGLPWYGLLKDIGYIEKNGVLFKKSIYYSTADDEQIVVLISNDYFRIIIFNNDDTIWEFYN